MIGETPTACRGGEKSDEALCFVRYQNRMLLMQKPESWVVCHCMDAEWIKCEVGTKDFQILYIVQHRTLSLSQ